MTTTSTDTAAWETVTAPAPDAGIRRDRYGRYLLPHPDTGKEQAWTRATTLANTLADRYGLEQWAKRNVVLGIGARSDLYAQAASCTVDDKSTLTQIVAQAEEAASSKAKANLGTALHRFTERVDAGEPVDVPDPWRADVDAYTATMGAAGLAVLPGWIERVLLIPDIGCAGTVDRVLDTRPLPKIADLKTGADVVRYGMTEIALQLSIYAHATHWWNPTTGDLHEMPPIDQEQAVVMHLPVGQATCTLYNVDITAGWEAVQLAVAVRDWRKRKDLAAQIPVAPVAGPTGAEAVRVEWIRSRVLALKEQGHIAEVAAGWPEGVPTLKQGGLTDAHVDQVAAVLDRIEAAHDTPFGTSDPLYAGFDTADQTPAPAPEPAPAIDLKATARANTTAARTILEQLDPAEQTAVRDLVIPTGATTTARHLEHIEAVCAELADPNGTVIFTYSTVGVAIESTDNGDRVRRGCRTKTEARLRGARLAQELGRPTPRTFDHLCADPLLAALVATGHGQPDTDNPTNPKE